MDPFQPAAIVMVPSGDGRWLTVTRPEPPYEAALPGGLVEAGETPRRAAQRELSEETGVFAFTLDRVGMGRDEYRRVEVFIAPIWDGEPRSMEAASMGGRGGRVAWMTFRELRAQAKRFGSFLDSLERGYRALYGQSP